MTTTPEEGYDLAFKSHGALCAVGDDENRYHIEVELPETDTETSGQSVDAAVCEMPFRPSVNPTHREIAIAPGRDWAA